MERRANQKMRILYVRDIMEQCRGRERGISIDAILLRLAERGILAERKSVRDDLVCLKAYGLPILCARYGRCNGYYLESRAQDGQTQADALY